MTSTQEGQPRLVAFLWFNDSLTQRTGYIPIHAPDNFYLGRLKPYGDRTLWHTDGTISHKHLRIHAISYEGGDTCKIQPLVYAEDRSTHGTWLKKLVTGSSEEKSDQAQRMKKGVAVLLEDGDELHVNPTLKFTYRLEEPEKYGVDGFSDLLLAEQKGFSDRYTITKRKLGAGGYGGVYLAYDRRRPRQLACKIINRIQQVQVAIVRGAPGENLNKKGNGQHDRKRPEAFEKQLREFTILQAVNHPNIISLEKVFWSDHTIYIFSELITAGDLFSYLEYKRGSLKDVEAAVIVRQILKALEYLHAHKIVHRDLKPDNILMTSLADGARIVLTDFGQARYLPERELAQSRQKQARYRMTSLVGTADYVAPEVHSRNHTMKGTSGYSEAVDMWSVGAVTALLLTGSHMFPNEIPDNGLASAQVPGDRAHAQQDLITSAAARCDLSRMDYGSEWENVGKRPKDFIRKLLILDESQRMTATQALAHGWFTFEHYMAELEDLYERAVKNWKPRKQIFRPAEYLGDQNLTRSRPEMRQLISERSSSPDLLSQEYFSPYFDLSASKRSMPRAIPSVGANHGPTTLATNAQTAEPGADDTQNSIQTEFTELEVSMAGRNGLYQYNDFNVSQHGPPIEVMRSRSPSTSTLGDASNPENVLDSGFFEEDPRTQAQLPLPVQSPPFVRGIQSFATQYHDSTCDETQLTIDPAALQCIHDTPRKDSKKRHRVSSYGRIDSDIYKDLSQSTGSCLVRAKAYKECVNVSKDKKTKLT